MLRKDDGIMPLGEWSEDDPQRWSGLLLDLYDCSNDTWIATSYRGAWPSDDSFQNLPSGKVPLRHIKR